MDPVFTTGLEWIKAIQQFDGPVLDQFFLAITFMGEELFYLLVIPFLIWSVDVKIGVRVGIAFLLSAYLNTALKELLPEPRPYQVDPTVGKSEAGGSGMPSGHAQNAVVFWGVLALELAKKWIWVLAVILMLLIGFSRIYLGVHFPHQVLAGWLIGLFFVAVYVVLDPRLEPWLAGVPVSGQIGLVLLVSVAMAIAFPVEAALNAAGVLAGFGVGFALTRQYVPYTAEGSWWSRILRFLLGAGIMLILYFGLSAVFAAGPESLSAVLRFGRYAILGLWISLGAPWLFAQLHLVERPSARPGLQS